jgi:lipopolysaccharide biosynthesis protein
MLQAVHDERRQTPRTLVRAVAIHLPQFHPVAENDEWWGKGFTEWTNVTRAKPLFRGHYQPHIPTELGFYDLRLAEVRAAQAELARSYGIHGFCYYHYWFNGRRILNRPVDEIVASGEPDFPFMLCWANENWTRRWDGHDQEILLRQEYSAADDVAHIRSLLPAFADPRYIRIDGRPVFMVYRTQAMPEPRRTADRWRDEVRRAGLGELYLVRVESFTRDVVPEAVGFDAAMPFAPDWRSLPEARRPSTWQRALRRAHLLQPFLERQMVIDYEQLARSVMRQPRVAHLRFPCVTPMWDNTARRPWGASIFHGSTPAMYGEWLSHAAHTLAARGTNDNLLFINAWNEWAEGNHLEPCARWGRAYLEATRDALTPRIRADADLRRHSSV